MKIVFALAFALTLSSGCHKTALEKIKVMKPDLESAAAIALGPDESAFSKAADAPTHFATTYEPFYDTGTAGSFSSYGSATIQYRYFLNPNATAGIFILPGRTESMRKYAEVIYDLYRQNYSIFIMSHRGQGESTHLVSNDPKKVEFQIGHVDKYTDFTDDVESFYQIVRSLWPAPQKLFMLAHSMGGAIGALYVSLDGNQDKFDAIALVSPMFLINTGKFTTSVAGTIALAQDGKGGAKQFALGGTGPAPENPDFNTTDNDVTGCRERFDMNVNILHAHKELKLGRVSAGWFYQWDQGTQRIREIGTLNIHNDRQNKTPTLIFSAIPQSGISPSGDDIVKISAHELYRSHNPNVTQIIQIPGAQHEILQEIDTRRNHALVRIVRFFRSF